MGQEVTKRLKECLKYQQLSYKEIKPLLPTVHEAIVTPAPSGIMFASGIRLAGVDLLAKHHIEEGMPLADRLHVLVEADDIHARGSGQCIDPAVELG